MNRTVAVLASVIVVLVATVGFLLGRQSQTEPHNAGPQRIADVRAADPVSATPMSSQQVTRSTEEPAWKDGTEIDGTCSFSGGQMRFTNVACSGAYGTEFTILSLGLSVSCNLIVEKSGTRIEARLENYRGGCRDSNGASPPIDGIAFGPVELKDRCWINDRMELCVEA